MFVTRKESLTPMAIEAVMKSNIFLVVVPCLLSCFVASTTYGQAKVAGPDLNIDGVMLTLPEQNCSDGSARWSQIRGPSVDYSVNGTKHEVLVVEPADYEFRYECCFDDGNRIDRLLNSPDKVGFGAATTGGADAQEFTVVDSLADEGQYAVEL
jgi:hypothetical protein